MVENQVVGAVSGSHPSDQAAARLGGSRFDPGDVASRLGKAQREVILSLSEDWGPASSHQTARRMWYGIRGDWLVIEHKHRTDNCWRLNQRGAALKEALAAMRPNLVRL